MTLNISNKLKHIYFIVFIALCVCLFVIAAINNDLRDSLIWFVPVLMGIDFIFEYLFTDEMMIGSYLVENGKSPSLRFAFFIAGVLLVCWGVYGLVSGG